MADFTWGIIGPGWIASEFAGDFELANSARHKVGAVLGRTMDSAKAFGQQFGTEACFDDINEFVKTKMDAVYIATPHPLHYRDTLICLRHRIPVLCEKPIAVNNLQYERMKAAASDNDTFLMEGMWIRFLPSITSTLAVLAEGRLGKVRSVRSTISYLQEKDPNNRFYDPELGGGSLLDLGSYNIYLALLLLGKPEQIEAQARLTDQQIDQDCRFVFRYAEEGVFASGHSTFIEEEPNISEIICEKGKIRIGDAWNADVKEIRVSYEDGTEQLIRPEWEGHGFQFQIDEVHRCIQSGKKEHPDHSLDLTTDLMKVMDEVRAKSGIVYPYDTDPDAIPED